MLRSEKPLAANLATSSSRSLSAVGVGRGKRAPSAAAIASEPCTARSAARMTPASGAEIARRRSSSGVRGKNTIQPATMPSLERQENPPSTPVMAPVRRSASVSSAAGISGVAGTRPHIGEARGARDGQQSSDQLLRHR